MPVKVQYLLEKKTLTPSDAVKWLKASGIKLEETSQTKEVIGKFLSNWNLTYGFLQAQRFSEHLKMYTDQVAVFAAISRIGEKIISDFPPAVYMYIGIGRSPAPIMAFLESRCCRVVNMPLSDFRPKAKEWSITDDALPGERITGERQKLLFEHFDNILHEKIKRRKVVVIDFASPSGASLVAAREQLETYFHLKKVEIEVHALCMCTDVDKRSVESTKDKIGKPKPWNSIHQIDRWLYSNSRTDWASRWHILAIKSFEGLANENFGEAQLSRLLKGQHFDGFAEYGSFKLLSGASDYEKYRADPTKIAGYRVLMEALKDVKALGLDKI